VLSRADVGEVGVPDVPVDLGHLDPDLVTPAVGRRPAEQAQFDALGDRREQGEVRAVAVVGRPERVRAADPLTGGWIRLGHRVSLPERAVGAADPAESGP